MPEQIWLNCIKYIIIITRHYKDKLRKVFESADLELSHATLFMYVNHKTFMNETFKTANY